MSETITATPPPLELMKVRDAAKRYPIGEDRLYTLINDGTIPAIIMKGARGQKRILVRPQAIEAWLLAQERHHNGATS